MALHTTTTIHHHPPPRETQCQQYCNSYLPNFYKNVGLLFWNYLPENVESEKVLGPKNFWPDKMLVQNWFFSKTLCQKKSCVQNNFGSKPILGPTKFWVQKQNGRYQSQTSLSPFFGSKFHFKEMFGSERFWIQLIMSSKIFSVKENIWFKKGPKI